MCVEGLHLKIIDFNPLPEQVELEAYCKVFHNGFPLEELPHWDLDEYLVEFKSDRDILKIEVWANDFEGKILVILVTEQ